VDVDIYFYSLFLSLVIIVTTIMYETKLNHYSNGSIHSITRTSIPLHVHPFRYTYNHWAYTYVTVTDGSLHMS